MAEPSPGRVVKTVPFIMSFPCLPPMDPRKDEDSGRETYQLAMLFPPGTDQAPFRTALRLAMVDKFGADPKQWPRCKQGPDQVLKDFEEYNANAKTPLAGDWKGWLLVRANAMVKKPPRVVGAVKGANGEFPLITDTREIYGGRWARAAIDSYHFDIKNKNNGVTFGLGNVQLLKNAPAFGAAPRKAEDDFDNASEEWSGQGDAFEKGSAAGADAAAGAGW